MGIPMECVSCATILLSYIRTTLFLSYINWLPLIFLRNGGSFIKWLYFTGSTYVINML